MAKKIWGILLILAIILVAINFKSIIKIFYPIQYENIVEKYSREYNIDKYVVYSLIRVESKFNPYARSNKNAAGLMQITGQTGKYIAKLLREKDFKSEDLFDPDTNIRFGCFYFSKLLRDFDGNLNLALAAYNGGEGNVRKWLEIDEHGRRVLDIESIPYSETKQYIKRVNKYFEIYKFLYSDKHYGKLPEFF